MKVVIDLTENDKRALERALFYAGRACEGTCVYDEMVNSKLVDCKNCCYVKGLDSLRRKFSDPKSIDDYTKKIRKEVCEEIKSGLDKDLSIAEDYWKVIKILEQVQTTPVEKD